MIRFFLVVLLCLICSAPYAQTGTLKVVVTNIESDKGVISVALYGKASKEQFLKDTKSAIQREIVEINSGKAFAVFSDVPFGTYAISVFHDENNNGKIDRTFIGFPSESTGISGNKFVFGPPDFKDAEFNLNFSEKKILIRLKSIF